MARISKAPDERKDEILEVSQRLFTEKGFQKTKVSDIVKAVGVSQGTFYYHFKSKEEAVDALIDRYLSEIVHEILPVMGDRSLSALEKLERMADSQFRVNMASNKNIHGIKGVDIHEKIIAQIVRRLVPLQVEVIQQGVGEGVFKTRQIRELTEIFVVAANMLFDPGIFNWNPDELERRVNVIIQLMESCFGAPEGSFGFYKRLMSGGRLAV